MHAMRAVSAVPRCRRFGSMVFLCNIPRFGHSLSSKETARTGPMQEQHLERERWTMQGRSTYRYSTGLCPNPATPLPKQAIRARLSSEFVHATLMRRGFWVVDMLVRRVQCSAAMPVRDAQSARRGIYTLQQHAGPNSSID